MSYVIDIVMSPELFSLNEWNNSQFMLTYNIPQLEFVLNYFPLRKVIYRKDNINVIYYSTSRKIIMNKQFFVPHPVLGSTV